jgi:PAS domain S-box-containing protein
MHGDFASGVYSRRVSQVEAAWAPRPVELEEDSYDLIEQSRRRMLRGLSDRDLSASLGLAVAFLVTAAAMAVLIPSHTSSSPLTVALLVVAYAITSRVEFEIGTGSVLPTELILVPMLFLAPVGAVPLLVALGLCLGRTPALLTRRAPANRILLPLVNSWHAVGPALVIGLAGGGRPSWHNWPVYLGALASQFGFDIASSATRERFALGVPLRTQLGFMRWAFLVDSMLAPVALAIVLAQYPHAYSVLLVMPLVALLWAFARERESRIDHAFELKHTCQRTAHDARATSERLSAAEATYRTLVERLPLVTYIVRLDAAGSCVYISPQVEELLGYSVEEWLSDSDLFPSLLHPDDRERVLDEIARARSAAAAGIPGREYRLLARDGHVVWVYDETVYLPDAHGRPQLAQGFLVDITERKRLEDELRQAQRMEVVGRLAGGIAHDFNNLITVIIGWVRMLDHRTASEDVGRKEIEQIGKAAERAAILTQQLLAFSRRQVLRPEVLDLNQVICAMHAMLERLIREDIQLRTSLDPELGGVSADRGQLEQVLLNLAVNARDAMPSGGRLLIETTAVEVSGSPWGEQLGLLPGRYARLIVSDTGHGMDERTRRQIFEPYFTTKDTGKGTGLGLATVYGIVVQSGGAITVESEPGAGARFTIHLPTVNAAVPEAAPPAPLREESLYGSELILLVEDDHGVRSLVHDVLARFGYSVLDAALPVDALITAKAHQGEIDLLLTDIVMPGMSGQALAEALKQTQPQMRTLYMSGYTNDTFAAPRLPDESLAFIAKPFDPELLVRRVRELLDHDHEDITPIRASSRERP